MTNAEYLNGIIFFLSKKESGLPLAWINKYALKDKGIHSIPSVGVLLKHLVKMGIVDYDGKNYLMPFSVREDLNELPDEFKDAPYQYFEMVYDMNSRVPPIHLEDNSTTNYGNMTTGNQSPLLVDSINPLIQSTTTTSSDTTSAKKTPWYAKPLFIYFIWPVLTGLLVVLIAWFYNLNH